MPIEGADTTGPNATRGSSRPPERFGSAGLLDGEAVVLGVDGISDFNALHKRKHETIRSCGRQTAR
jgi:hypothetical protein